MKTLTGLLLLLAGMATAAPLIPIRPEQRDALGIRTTTVETAARSWGPSFPASVRLPNDQLMVVTAPLEGLIARMEVATGQTVNQGQPLALIQSPQLVEAQQRYLEALSRLELARTSLERDRQLHEEGIISERRFLETRAHFNQAQAAADQHRQVLKLAGMDETALQTLEQQQRLSAELWVRAPMEGQVLEQLATAGQRVEIASPLYHIGQLNPLWLEIQVPLERLSAISPGMTVRVKQHAVQGHILTIGSTVHGESQSVQVRAEIPNPDHALRPGQFVEVQWAGIRTGTAWRIPRQALIRIQDAAWILVARTGGFMPLPVSVLAEETNTLVIEGELKAGDQVAISGTAALKAAWQEAEN